MGSRWPGVCRVLLMALFGIVLCGLSGLSLLKAELVPEFAPIRETPANSGMARETAIQGTGRQSHSPGQTFTEPTTGMEFVWVPGGCYQMGSNEGDGDEKPVHRVCVAGFWMGKYEVTVGQWQRFVKASGYKTDAERDAGGNKGSYVFYKNDTGKWSWGWVDGRDWRNPGFSQADTYPVCCVSYNDVEKFASWLNHKSSRFFRLPTEAEWEYAARSGGRDEIYAGGNDVDRVSWYDGNSGGSTHSVGGKAANGLGLYDMSGNVWEWCADWYSSDYYEDSPKRNPTGPDSGSSRVSRGGSWDFRPGRVRSANRLRGRPASRDYDLGFRLVSPGR